MGAITSGDAGVPSLIDCQEAAANTEQVHHEKTSSSASIAQFERRQSQTGLQTGQGQLVDNVHAVIQDNRRMVCHSFAYPSQVASPNADGSARKSD